MALTTTTTDVSGITPDSHAALIVEPLERLSLAFNPAVATVIKTDSTTVNIPVIREDASAAWLTEGAEISPTDAEFDEIEVTPAKVGGLSKISRELAEDSSPAAANLVGESLARDVARKIDAAFFGNLSSPAPSGLASLEEYDETTAPLGYSALSYGATLEGIDWAAEAISVAEERGAAITAFVTTPAMALAIAQLKTGDGQNTPLLGVDATNGTTRQLLGVPILVSPSVETGVIWGLDSSRNVTVLRNDVRVESSREAYFTSDNVAVKTTARVGFAFASTRSLVKIEAGS